MTREECESKILEKLKEIKKIYESYISEDKYLTMVIFTDSISLVILISMMIMMYLL